VKQKIYKYKLLGENIEVCLIRGRTDRCGIIGGNKKEEKEALNSNTVPPKKKKKKKSKVNVLFKLAHGKQSRDLKRTVHGGTVTVVHACNLRT
jgi:hypothetical protein